MTCDIIIAVHNQLEYTKGCIESVQANTDFNCRILVVDDASHKETAVYLDNLAGAGRIILLRNAGNLGWVESVNRGIEFSKADYVCVMNNDTIVFPGWLQEMIEIAETDISIGLVNPCWELPRGRGMKPEVYFKRVISKRGGRYVETDWVRGFCFLIKRAVIDKIGGLDKAFIPAYYDDWDYSVRAIKAGFTCVIAEGAFVWHYKNISYGSKATNELMRRKRGIFHKRWGVPVKVLLIDDAAGKSARASSIPDLVKTLLMDQNLVKCVSSGKFFCLNRHTNLKHRRISKFLSGIYIIAVLLDNARHSESKRYDMIICPERVYGFLKAMPVVNNIFSGRFYSYGRDDNRSLTAEIMSVKRHKTQAFLKES